MSLDPEIVTLLAWAIFAGACGLTLFLGAVLAYHWYRYAFNTVAAAAATVAYFLGSGACLAGIAYTILTVT